MDTRYDRQMIMPKIGDAGQEALRNAVVLVVGAGGLGSLVLYHLAAAGVGRMMVIDADCVEHSNLNRQMIHTPQDVGIPKVHSAAQRLQRFNPDVLVQPIHARLCQENVAELVQNADIVLCCVDNFATRLLLNTHCLHWDTPLVDGGIHGWNGYVTCVRRGEACLACGTSLTDSAQVVPSLGAMVGVIASLQAVECIKILLAAGDALYSALLVYDALYAEMQTVPCKQNPHCAVCTQYSART